MDKKEIYRSIITSNATSPNMRNGKLEGVQALLVKSQTCNDNFEIFLKIEDGVVSASSFTGNGCAVSTASINLLLNRIEHQPLSQAQALVTNYLNLIFKGNADPKELGDLMAFEYTSNFVNRIECATIGAKAIMEALHG